MIRLLDQSSKLRVHSEWYRKYLSGLADLWFLSDLNNGTDVTTKIVKGKKDAKANIIVKSNAVLAGVPEIEWLFKNHPRFKGCKIKFHISDGNKVKRGKIIAEVSGKYAVLMRVERIVLNILQRMSGIATETKRLSDKVREYGVKLACTRKTYFGPLDKKACSVGGGLTHRLGLWDAVMIKDNHFDMGFDLSHAKGVRFVEIEVENLRQLDRAILELKVLRPAMRDCALIVMLDNFDIKKIPEAINRLHAEEIAVEISGGINKSNLVKYAKLRPDVISMGCLTQGAKASDIGMEL
ncbi:MAG: nicotinate-nucleotide pyrophosphorylase, nicotinate-nucleotide pyrophosphorylase (carboxylating) [Candidatus Peregrinibacteria bacterium GW2011_GWF2_43_17]|nr:MAG: nicotinate-nucleotide pyrophosphorylase, nicotinate-nucleotide pyrophosphorylase (carboxylating) [Candidatus Peregrinibacteria bacterium GW2011_GWF2_43_17]KKT18473.1 MAG: Nicotinate-nucleotide pyrophosphorylase [Candidatus Peregrinibacteria bacterium GW2011_GWA2_43_8]HAU39713.1 carboxylating nicotinate-nucleotide diphosphorylase [Candidatus Peregrinibacteria bacterium]